MKSKVQVVNVEEVSGTSKKSGTQYKFQKLHCIVHPEKEGDGLMVGILIPPHGIENVVPGTYEAEFGLTVDREQRIGGVLKSLTPLKVASVGSPAKVA